MGILSYYLRIYNEFLKKYKFFLRLIRKNYFYNKNWLHNILYLLLIEKFFCQLEIGGLYS